jgi:hypothetical protein
VNNQYNIKGANDPRWSKPCHLSNLLNQPGEGQGTGKDQVWSDSIPELMNQGGSTKHGGKDTHTSGKNTPASFGKMLGQGG